MKPTPQNRLIVKAIRVQTNAKLTEKPATTRRQLKHELYLSFIAQSKRKKTGPKRKKFAFLRNMLAIFF